MTKLFEQFMEHLKNKTSQGAAGSFGLFGLGSAPEILDVTHIQTKMLLIMQKDIIFVLQAGALLASIFVAVLTSVAWFEKRKESRLKKKNIQNE